MGRDKIRMGKDLIIDTTIKDQDGRRIEHQVCMRVDYAKIVKLLNGKYDLRIPLKEENKKSDLDWALG